MPKNKRSIVLTILIILVSSCLVTKILNKDLENVSLCILTLFLFAIPYLAKRLFKINISENLEILYFFFIFLTQILGEVYNFYVSLSFWDKLFHATSGFILSSIGFSIIHILNKKNIPSNLTIILFTFCFSMTCAIVWEFYEFGADTIFNQDMQKDNLVNVLSTKKLITNSKILKIDDISKTILYDKNGKELLKIDGYLDIGIKDTMQDLLAGLIGTLIYTILAYIHIKDNSKLSCINKVILTKAN